jgi:dTDP-4-amino-4,6-dideoxygalactose transaminase
VITTPRTFLASASSIVTSGASPVFADVDVNSQNITAQSIEAVLTPNTKAVIVVHLAGMPAEMDDIMALSKKHGFYVIEDCAQAHGAKYKGKSVGTIGHIGAWSFCQDKIMTTGGEGGMVTTNDKTLWSKMWSYKDHGKSFDAIYNREHPPGFRWLHESFGTNWRMTEMQAVIGRIQLKRMAEWTKKRQANGKAIDDAVADLSVVRMVKVAYYIEHAEYKHYLFVEPVNLASGWTRDRIVVEINALGVPAFQGSCSEVYLEKAFDGTPWRPAKRLTNAVELGETSLMFLVHPTLTEAEVTKTCTVIREVLQRAQR